MRTALHSHSKAKYIISTKTAKCQGYFLHFA